MDNTQRQSILCPSCRKLINRDIARCPYCGIRTPGATWRKLLLPGALRTDRLLTVIIAANIVMYVLTLIIKPGLPSLAVNPLRFLAPDNRSLLLMGATGTIPVGQLHRWWTLISASYLHGGLLHILFNMIALKQLGSLVLTEFGPSRMFIIYTLGGAVGYLASIMAGIPITIGASASVCALIGAAIYFGKSRGGVYGQAVSAQIGSWAVGILIFGLLVPGINNWGHGGGFLGGIALAALLGYQEKLPENNWHKALAGLCIIMTLLILLWAAASGIAVYARMAAGR